MIAERTVYMWNRWHDPSIGRFISQDPVRDGSNWYGYAGGNPVNNVDPMGLDWTSSGGYIPHGATDTYRNPVTGQAATGTKTTTETRTHNAGTRAEYDTTETKTQTVTYTSFTTDPPSMGAGPMMASGGNNSSSPSSNSSSSATSSTTTVNIANQTPPPQTAVNGDKFKEVKNPKFNDIDKTPITATLMYAFDSNFVGVASLVPTFYGEGIDSHSIPWYVAIDLDNAWQGSYNEDSSIPTIQGAVGLTGHEWFHQWQYRTLWNAATRLLEEKGDRDSGSNYYIGDPRLNGYKRGEGSTVLGRTKKFKTFRNWKGRPNLPVLGQKTSRIMSPEEEALTLA